MVKRKRNIAKARHMNEICDLYLRLKCIENIQE